MCSSATVSRRCRNIVSMCGASRVSGTCFQRKESSCAGYFMWKTAAMEQCVEKVRGQTVPLKNTLFSSAG